MPFASFRAATIGPPRHSPDPIVATRGKTVQQFLADRGLPGLSAAQATNRAYLETLFEANAPQGWLDPAKPDASAARVSQSVATAGFSEICTNPLFRLSACLPRPQRAVMLHLSQVMQNGPCLTDLEQYLNQPTLNTLATRYLFRAWVMDVVLCGNPDTHTPSNVMPGIAIATTATVNDFPSIFHEAAILTAPAAFVFGHAAAAVPAVAARTPSTE